MRVRLFDDWKSTIHFLIPHVMVLDSALGVPAAFPAATAAYIAYQLREREKMAYKAGDFVEYLAGCVTAHVLTFLLRALGVIW